MSVESIVFRKYRGILLLGAGLFPLIRWFTSEARHGGFWIVPLFGLLCLLGAAVFSHDFANPYIRIGPSGLKLKLQIKAAAVELSWDEIGRVVKRGRRLVLETTDGRSLPLQLAFIFGPAEKTLVDVVNKAAGQGSN